MGCPDGRLTLRCARRLRASRRPACVPCSCSCSTSAPSAGRRTAAPAQRPGRCGLPWRRFAASPRSWSSSSWSRSPRATRRTFSRRRPSRRWYAGGLALLLRRALAWVLMRGARCVRRPGRVGGVRPRQARQGGAAAAVPGGLRGHRAGGAGVGGRRLPPVRGRYGQRACAGTGWARSPALTDRHSATCLGARGRQWSRATARLPTASTA